MELVVCGTILAITVIGVMGAFAGGFRTINMARENQRATQVMLEKAETIRLYNWDQVNTAGFIPSTFTNVYDPQAPVGKQGCTYYGTVTVGPFPSHTSYAPNIRLLTITLDWQTDGVSRSRKFVTLIAKDGLQNYVY
ncbi:MAG TPA: hypothetical protein PKA41_05715 [Verrucomicrobiota bacterium]|nr:hypothetical protein [Verrucomicrobiota bacterium]